MGTGFWTVWDRLELDPLSDLVQEGVPAYARGWRLIVLLHLLQLGTTADLLQQGPLTPQAHARGLR